MKLPNYGPLLQSCFRKKRLDSTAKYVGRLLVPKPLPDGRLPLVDIYAGTVTTWMTVAGQRDCILGVATHADECAPQLFVGARTYDRVHTVDGVGVAGGGFGFALYLGAALAREMRGAIGVFSIPRSQPRAKKRSTSAEALWMRMKTGAAPVAHQAELSVSCCQDEDFTAVERRGRMYKTWVKESEEYDLPLEMRRFVDLLDGADARESGYVVELALVEPDKGKVLQREYEAALPELTRYYESLPEGPAKAALAAADDQYQEGQPNALVRLARKIVPGAFPTFGIRMSARPWATHKPVDSSLYRKAFDAGAALSGVAESMLVDAVEVVRVSGEEAAQRLGRYSPRLVEVRQEWRGRITWLRTYAGFDGTKLVGYFTRRRDGKLRWHDASASTVWR